MRKIVCILSVIILSVCGCGKADVNDTNTVGKVKIETTTSGAVTDKIIPTHQTETVDKQEEATTQAISETKAETSITPTTEAVKASNKEEVRTEPPTELPTKPQAEPQKKPETEVPTTKAPAAETPVKEVQTEKVTEPPTKEKPSIKSYNPNEVVKLATAKTKKAGKILLTENLDKLLANGTITKAEYDEYYPYDGTGYYSVFVETDLNTASAIGGEKLSSVEAIANYIAGMMVLESGDFFLIEYAGTIDHHGTPLYEFRCYRA